jgi:hypothetical protein
MRRRKRKLIFIESSFYEFMKMIKAFKIKQKPVKQAYFIPEIVSIVHI